MEISSKKNNDELKEITNINKISKHSYFIIEVKKSFTEIKNLIVSEGYIPKDSHIQLFKTKINEIIIFEGDENETKNIEIIPYFYRKLNNLKECPKENSEYAQRIKSILSTKKGKKVITLKYIQNQYKIIYKKNISLITISRVLRFHLKMHFRKTSIKNPKLLKENYLLMEYSFLIGIIRSLEENLNIVYIDETGFQNDNNNLRLWRQNNESIFGGPEADNKKRINLILAINSSEILLAHYYNNQSIGTNEFIIFMKELVENLGEEETKNSIFIMDNASYHVSKKTKIYYKEAKLKILFNCPYKSDFNAIELVFNLIKNNLRKEIHKNQKDYAEKIVKLINDEIINDNVKKVYKKTLENYLSFYLDNISKIKNK